MTENKQQAKKSNTGLAIVAVGIAVLIYFISKYPVYFAVGAVVVLGIGILTYYKVPKFHDFIHEKLHLKANPNGLPTAQVRQGNGTATAQSKDLKYMCQLANCGGLLEQATNLGGKDYYVCNACNKVQRIMKS
jgi:hypothetical protein